MGGYQQLVRGEPFRGKFRHSFEKPEPFTPGKVDEINFTMQDVNHTFRAVHRIMVQVRVRGFRSLIAIRRPSSTFLTPSLRIS